MKGPATGLGWIPALTFSPVKMRKQPAILPPTVNYLPITSHWASLGALQRARGPAMLHTDKAGHRALTIWMEFSVDFFARMEQHFFSPRKRNENELYHLILTVQTERE